MLLAAHVLAAGRLLVVAASDEGSCSSTVSRALESIGFREQSRDLLREVCMDVRRTSQITKRPAYWHAVLGESADAFRRAVRDTVESDPASVSTEFPGAAHALADAVWGESGRDVADEAVAAFVLASPHAE
jgi:hypothetical protein